MRNGREGGGTQAREGPTRLAALAETHTHTPHRRRRHPPTQTCMHPDVAPDDRPAQRHRRPLPSPPPIFSELSFQTAMTHTPSEPRMPTLTNIAETLPPPQGAKRLSHHYHTLFLPPGLDHTRTPLLPFVRHNSATRPSQFHISLKRPPSFFSLSNPPQTHKPQDRPAK